MYKKHANAMPVIGVPTVESGVAPAIDHGISGATTTALFSRLMANSSLSFCDGAQSWCVRMIVNVWLQARRLARTAVSSIEA